MKKCRNGKWIHNFWKLGILFRETSNQEKQRYYLIKERTLNAYKSDLSESIMFFRFYLKNESFIS